MVEDNDGIHIKGPANFVPAAAVKRRGRVLFIVTGVKACSLKVKFSFKIRKVSLRIDF